MRAHWIIILFVVVISCSWSGDASHSITPGGIALQTDLPRGGGFTDPSGKDFGYRIFRVHATNDSTVPAELAIDFPGGPVALLPDTDRYISVFLFPDEITPDTVVDEFDFGITGSVSFIRSRRSEPTSLKATILPGEDHLLYIGAAFASDGLGRAELFFDGQKPNASFFPEGSVPIGTIKENELDLIFGVAIDPPEHYSMVPCGRIVFKQE